MNEQKTGQNAQDSYSRYLALAAYQAQVPHNQLVNH
jgi:hypothetical protein